MSKVTGSYYTPSNLTEFIVTTICQNLRSGKTKLLEPSVGDGAFLKSLIGTFKGDSGKSIDVTAVEINSVELEKAKKVLEDSVRSNINSTFIDGDFLEIQKDLGKFDIVLGNPPYIKKSHLDEGQSRVCKAILSESPNGPITFTNIWTAFLVRCCELLTENGVLSFVLPSELLQVQYSHALRKLLASSFDRVEIFTFSELLFSCEGQDTVVLFAYKQHSQKGQFYSHIAELSDLKNGDFELRRNLALSSTNLKWTHHFLSEADIQFLANLRKALPKIGDFCESRPGIVTAANNFFIVDAEKERKYELRQYTRPIVQKSSFVNGSVDFSLNEYSEILLGQLPSRIVLFNGSANQKMGKKTLEYLELGELANLQNRYKMRQRDKWFVIPNIVKPGEGFFFKRSHSYPKLIKNSAKVYSTDAAYNITMRDGFDIQSLIHSFYGYITQVFCELDGRYYGGGVLELTPKEFKSLPLAYEGINDKGFNEFKNRFEHKSTIEEILDDNGVKWLGGDDLKRLKLIYNKLKKKRLRVTP